MENNDLMAKKLRAMELMEMIKKNPGVDAMLWKMELVVVQNEIEQMEKEAAE